REFASDIDIDLADGTTDADYLKALAHGLGELFARCTSQLVIYLAGADPYEDDRLGRLKLSFAGLEARDRLVFEACRARGIPVAIAMAGGYARQIEHTVRIHAATITLARRQWGFPK
ncbi:MAG: histone deacetylase, partial [Burkholderiales bacterium]